MQQYFSRTEMEMIAWRISAYINFRSNDAYLRGEFNKWDTNGNGILEREEIKRMMNNLYSQNIDGSQVGNNQQALDYLFQRFDTDGSGGFSFDEFKNVSYYTLKVLAKQQLMRLTGTNDFTPLLTRYKNFVLNFFQYISQEQIYNLLFQNCQNLSDEQKYQKIEQLVNNGYSNPGYDPLSDYCFMYSIVAVGSPDWIAEIFDVGNCFQRIWGLPEIIDQTINSLLGD